MNINYLKNIKDVINSNFNNFCITASDLSNSQNKICKHYKWSKNPFDNWFSRIYDINIPNNLISDEVKKLRFDIEKGELPFLLITTENQESNNLLKESFNLNNFNMFYEQTGMAMDLDKLGEIDNPNNYEIKTINNMIEFNKWNDIIEIVFKDRKKYELYSKLLNSKNFTFFGCYYEQSIIATTLLYIKNDIAGIHMVATSNEFRNKGIGTLITKKTFEFAKLKGAKIGVLQSSPMGKSMYKNIGFQDYSRIYHWEYKFV